MNTNIKLSITKDHKMTIIQSSAANQNSRKNALRLAVAPLALAIGLGQVVPAYATIDNTVTVTGTSPSAATITDTGLHPLNETR